MRTAVTASESSAPEEFAPAFERALQSERPAILHCIVDPQALTPTMTLDAISERAKRERPEGRAEQ